ncbi:MAG: YdaU family protein [Paraburkholderia sp.]|jgi:hypothetical protein|nr:YdaU family protein [Paraburkholderia sp.]
MTDLPEPLTPPDCDLRKFREMPIDVPRLLGSDLVHDESPEACWSAMLLWCVSWHEVPAGSLPDNDEWLAKRAGYWHKGKLDPTWHEVRGGALHGWIQCSDGRRYHPVVAEKVNNSWRSMHKHAHGKLSERIRKRNQTRVEKGLLPLEIPELEPWIEMGRPLERDLFPSEFSSPSGGKHKPSAGTKGSSAGSDGFFHGDSAGIPPENPLNGTERNGEEVNTIGSNDDVGSVKHKGPVDNSAAPSSFDEDYEEGDRITPDRALEASRVDGAGAVSADARERRGGASNRVTGISGSELDPANACLPVDEIVALLRQWEKERGKGDKVRLDINDEVIAAWRVTREQLHRVWELAVAQRRKDHDPSAVNAGFLDRFIAKVLAPPRVVKPPLRSMTGPQLEAEAVRLSVHSRGKGRDELIALIEHKRTELRGGHAA